MRRLGYILFVVLMAIHGIVSADTFWTGGGDDDYWQNAANWDTGVPGAGATGVARINAGYNVNYNSDTGTLLGLAVNLSNNYDGLATMTMTGGTYSTPATGSNWFVIGFGNGAANPNPGSAGLLEVQTGATLYVGSANPISSGDLCVGGHGGGDGILNVTGGTIQAWQVLVGWFTKAGYTGYAEGTVNLKDGKIILPKPTGGLFLNTTKGHIDIELGQIEQIGDFRTGYETLIGAGAITGYGLSSNVVVDYDNIKPGWTVVYAVPEPATMLLLLFGLPLIRRNKNII